MPANVGRSPARAAPTTRRRYRRASFPTSDSRSRSSSVLAVCDVGDHPDRACERDVAVTVGAVVHAPPHCEASPAPLQRPPRCSVVCSANDVMRVTPPTGSAEAGGRGPAGCSRPTLSPSPAEQPSGLEAGGNRVDAPGRLLGPPLRVEDLDEVDRRELLERGHDLVGDREGRATARAAARQADPGDAVTDAQAGEAAGAAVDEGRPAGRSKSVGPANSAARAPRPTRGRGHPPGHRRRGGVGSGEVRPAPLRLRQSNGWRPANARSTTSRAGRGQREDTEVTRTPPGRCRRSRRPRSRRRPDLLELCERADGSRGRCGRALVVVGDGRLEADGQERVTTQGQRRAGPVLDHAPDPVHPVAGNGGQVEDDPVEAGTVVCPTRMSSTRSDPVVSSGATTGARQAADTAVAAGAAVPAAGDAAMGTPRSARLVRRSVARRMTCLRSWSSVRPGRLGLWS